MGQAAASNFCDSFCVEFFSEVTEPTKSSYLQQFCRAFVFKKISATRIFFRLLIDGRVIVKKTHSYFKQS